MPTISLDTTRSASLPAEIWFELVDAAGEPLLLTDADDGHLLYRAEWGAGALPTRRGRPCGVPGVLRVLLDGAEVAQLDRCTWDLRVATAQTPSASWASGRIATTLRIADGDPDADMAQRVKVTLRVEEAGDVQAVGTTVYRGPRGRRGPSGGLSEADIRTIVAEMIVAAAAGG